MEAASEASGFNSTLGEADGDALGYDAPGPDVENWVLCGDGKWYKRRIVAGTAAMVMTSSTHPGSIKRAERIEAAIHAAIMKAVSEGVQVGSPELTIIINAARNAAMEDIS
jgi:hypothetical protein